MLAAQRVPGVPRIQGQTFLLFGAGQANLGFAMLLQEFLARMGVPKSEAKKRIWLFDSQVYPGLVHHSVL
jgi:malic enzyme